MTNKNSPTGQLYYRFLPQQKPLPRSHFPHLPSKVLNLSDYVI